MSSTTVSVAPVLAPAAAAGSPPPAAVVYVPGINARSTDPAEVAEVARRLARRLDQQDADVAITYETRAAATEPYGSGDEVKFADVYEIVRNTPGRPEAVTHRVYRLNYDAQLGDATADNLFAQFFAVGMLSVKWTARFATQAFRAGSLGGREKIALLLGGFTLVTIISYLAILFLGVVMLAVGGGDPASANLDFLDTAWKAARESATMQSLRGLLDAVIPGGAHGMKVAAQISTVAAALFSFVGLGFGGIRAWLGQQVDMFLRFSRYFDDGHGRSACVGQFNDLLEHILESDEPPSHIDVVAYSMGSVIALDALFPSNGVKTPRGSAIRTLSTIGCPFDLVRTFWREYFERRTLPDGGLRWINLYSPVDLLGSNFANAAGQVEQPTYGINAANPMKTAAAQRSDSARCPDRNLNYDHAGRVRMGFWEVILFGGFRAHAQYWAPGHVEAESCFTPLVAELYS